MNPIARILAAAIVLAPVGCYAAIGWDFEDNSMPPNDLVNSSVGGSWAVGPSVAGIGAGNVIRAELDSPALLSPAVGSGAGEEPPVFIDTYSPEFRFQDIRAALLDFNFDIESENCEQGGNCVESLLVTLHKMVSGLPIDETFLWQFFTFEPPPADMSPFPIVPAGQFPPSGHENGLTTYRIRLRVHDGDENKHTLVGAEIDNLLLTSAISNVTGDYNSNFIVDAADYTVWRDILGQVGTVLAADGDRDGSVDQDDYNVWKSHFGSGGSGAEQAAFQEMSAEHAVPEPRSINLLSLVAIGLAVHPSAWRWFGRRENPLPGRLD